MNQPLLSFHRIGMKIPCREYPILEDVSFEIFPEDFIMLVGGNGSGKSSLIKMINGLISPTSGRIDFQGKNLLDMPLHRRARSIVTLTQDLQGSGFSDLTVLENCLLASDRNRITYPFFPRRREKEEIELYLRSFSLPLSQKLQEKVSSLSGGERQTLALAMHLRSSPSLLLLDEHTSALDPRMGKKVMEITDAAARKQRIPTVVTTHNLDDALNYGNRLIAMNQGKIILDTGKTGKRDLTKDLLLSIYESKAPI